MRRIIMGKEYRINLTKRYNVTFVKDGVKYKKQAMKFQSEWLLRASFMPRVKLKRQTN